MRRVLIGTVGYYNLRDYSIGPMLLPRLRELKWPPNITVEEMSWGPIAIVQDFQSRSQPYNRVAFLCARPSARAPGTITLRRWRGGLPNADNIQARVSEAVTGVISIDNLLVIGEYYKIWPDEVLIVDVEPGVEEMGETFTPEVEAQLSNVMKAVQRVAKENLTTFEELLLDMRGDQLGTETN